MIDFFAKHPTAANLLMIIFLVMGIMSVSSLRRETFPDFSSDEVEIRVIYPGASAEDIEQAICQRIEDALDQVNYVEEIRSEAREGIGIVVAEMQESGDFGKFIDDVKTEVEAIDNFPDQAEDPVIKELGSTDRVVSIAVNGPMSPDDLKTYCEDIKDRLKIEAGISLVSIQGFSDLQIRIQIPAQTLMQHGISMADIAGIISGQSLDMPLGTIKTRESELLIRFTDERKSPEEFRDLIVISNQNGSEIRLGDIADIQVMFELDEDKFIFNNQRAGLLDISKTKSEDALKIFDKVKAFIEKENQVKPPDVHLGLTQDISSIVKDRLQMLVTNGWQGLILVFLTMWLFFNIRLSFWVSLGLPVSFLGAFFFLPHIGYSLNMITMVGLLIALGLLMDDAIVIAENVATHLQKGKTAVQAAISGTAEVQNGVLSSFATTLLIFGPISFLEGNIGKILKVMPVILILVLSVSLVEAFWILPSHMAHSLKHYDPKKVSRFRMRFDNMIEWARENIMGTVIDTAVRWRYLFAGLAIAAFILSVGMLVSGNLKFKAFPDIDGDVLQARILLPQGTPLERTEAVVKRITDAMETVDKEFTPKQPGGQELVKSIAVQYNFNPDAHEQGAHVATVSVDLLKAEKRNARLDHVLNRWRELIGRMPDVISLKFTEPTIVPGGLPIDIRLQADDLDLLKKASLEMQSWINQFAGVFDLSDDLRPGKPEIRIRMKEGSMSLGLNARTVAAQIGSAYYGKTTGEIQVRGESYEIDVRLKDEDKNSLADLAYFHVTLADGKQVPLGSVAVLTQERGYARIASVNSQRTVTIQGDIDSRVINAAELTAMLKKDFLPGFKENYPGVRVSFEGEAKESAKTGTSLRRGFLIGLIGIFILLSFQFRSYIEPLIVMLAIPFAFIGVVTGHILMGLDLSMPSMMGAVSLAGIVVNDSILLVEFIKIKRRSGYTVSNSARQAARERFRAVMLTSLTTMAGLLPLLAEKSLQAQILIPLATSIVFGIMASTVMVLVIIPCLYSILGDFGFVEDLES
ncbi:Acriflavin resistance protein [Desulfonema limicola]|uniref:Acriflavin resistance protein n=1 Tax=Desulfonema limicola TaxID=45656 RepID=A0A975B8A3_9BACT|nr:efflux RND transporter permease subunit [Desulfonema limicola]QTA80492.1 Acriflavin resistance protein [Desulfonema limicola]